MKNKLIKFGILMIVLPPLIAGFPYSSQIDSLTDVSNSCIGGTSTWRGAYLTMKGLCESSTVVLYWLGVIFVMGVGMVVIKIIHTCTIPLIRILKKF